MAESHIRLLQDMLPRGPLAQLGKMAGPFIRPCLVAVGNPWALPRGRRQPATSLVGAASEAFSTGRSHVLYRGISGVVGPSPTDQTKEAGGEITKVSHIFFRVVWVPKYLFYFFVHTLAIPLSCRLGELASPFFVGGWGSLDFSDGHSPTSTQYRESVSLRR